MSVASKQQWREKYPELRRAEIRAETARIALDPEARARRNAQVKARFAMKPESAEKRRLSKAKWLATAGNRERWYANSLKTLAAQPWRRAVGKARNRSKELGWECDLNNVWAAARWTGKCEMTGLDFAPVSKKAQALSPSIDRIDSAKGYTQDNCRFVLWAVNRFKNDGTDAEMLAIARALVERA